MAERARFPALALAVLAVAAAQAPYPTLGEVEERVRQRIDEAHGQVQRAPSDASAWGRYGMVLDAHRLLSEAADAYRQAALLDPDEMRWSYFLATLLEYQDPTAALEWYERATRLRPSYAPAKIRYAQTLETVGRDEDAAAHYHAAAQLDPSNPLAPFGMGRLALSDDRVEEALGHLQQAYRLDGGTRAIVISLARAYARSGQETLARQKVEEARGLPEALPHKDPLQASVLDEAVDSHSYLHRARTYADVGDLPRARREIEELLSFAPDFAEAWLVAAGIYDRQGAVAEALRAARRVLAIDPDRQGAQSVVAGALVKLGRFDEGEGVATQVLEGEPDNVHMLMLVAMSAAQRGAVDEVIENLDHAYAVRNRGNPLAPVMAQLYDDLAASFADIGRFEEAAARMSQALDVAQESGAPAPQLSDYRQRLTSYRRSAGR